MVKLLSRIWSWVKLKTETPRAIALFFAKLSGFALLCTVVYVACVIAYPFAMIFAAKEQYKHQEDLVLNDKNEIIVGSVQQGQHPLNVRSRPQPTWYQR